MIAGACMQFFNAAFGGSTSRWYHLMPLLNTLIGWAQKTTKLQYLFRWWSWWWKKGLESGKAYLLSTSNSRSTCCLQRRIGNVPRVSVANTTEMSLQWTLLNENVWVSPHHCFENVAVISPACSRKFFISFIHANHDHVSCCLDNDHPTTHICPHSPNKHLLLPCFSMSQSVVLIH